MRRRLITGQHSAVEGINVTPLIDVVMCMIIFFLLVGTLATNRGAPVNLPNSIVGREETAASVLVVTVATRPGGADAAAPGLWDRLGIFVQADGDQMKDQKSLESAVRAKLASATDTSIQVRADRSLTFGAVEPVLRACGQAGARSVRLASEKQP